MKTARMTDPRAMGRSAAGRFCHVALTLTLTLTLACAADPRPSAADAGAERPEQTAQPVPFGSRRTSYAPGVILPTGGRAALDDAVRQVYARWKAAYLAAGCGGHYIRTAGGTGAPDAITVSEGHGYGMLITAFMAGEDPDAQATFDGLARVFRRFPSRLDTDLMAWAIGSGCAPVAGPNSATDGDLDIAFAFLLANRQWGSRGAIDYLGEASKVIAAIARSETNPVTRLPLLGDWATSAEFFHSTRPSDFMPDHLRAFAALAPSQPAFSEGIERIYQMVGRLQVGAPTTGLLPDFVIDTDGDARPARAGFLEGPQDGDYYYNACRVPWRLATDFVVSGEPRARAALAPINAWITRQTGGDPRRIAAGYRLDGQEIAPGAQPANAAFVGPFAVAAMVDAGNQRWLDALWRWLVDAPAEGYYADSIRLLTMLVVSGNWWSPALP